MGALDKHFDGLGNIVLRNADGTPSVFVRHPKQNSREFSASLPDHVHPAFVVGETTDPALLIGKYAGSVIDNAASSPIYSLPNAEPLGHPSQGPSFSAYLSRMRAFPGATGMTIADHGLLMCELQSWMYTHQMTKPVHGNTANGGSYSVAPGWTFNATQAYAFHPSVGSKAFYKGWIYECLVEHYSTAKTMNPEDNPRLWKRLYKGGGTPVTRIFALHDNQRGYTLTGSGPADWYVCHDQTQEADILGNGTEPAYGIRLYHGELQVLPNNDAADPGANVFSDSTLWKAVLPDGSGGHTYVAPGTSGTVKLAKSGSINFKWVARDLASGDYSQSVLNMYFDQIGCDIASPPALLYELGLLPLPEIRTACTTYGVHLGLCKAFILSAGESYMTVGNGYGEAEFEGIGAFSFNQSPSTATQQSVCRPRARETA